MDCQECNKNPAEYVTWYSKYPNNLLHPKFHIICEQCKIGNINDHHWKYFTLDEYDIYKIMRS